MRLQKSLVPLTFFSILILVSCNDSGNKELLLKKWTLVSFNPNPELQIPDSLRKVMENSQFIEYAADGKYRQTSNGIDQSGTYTLSEEGKVIQYNYTVNG